MIDPVWVRVGNKAIWAASKLGPMDEEGKAEFEAIWAAAMVGEATPPVADAGKLPLNWKVRKAPTKNSLDSQLFDRLMQRRHNTLPRFLDRRESIPVVNQACSPTAARRQIRGRWNWRSSKSRKRYPAGHPCWPERTGTCSAWSLGQSFASR